MVAARYRRLEARFPSTKLISHEATNVFEKIHSDDTRVTYRINTRREVILDILYFYEFVPMA